MIVAKLPPSLTVFPVKPGIQEVFSRCCLTVVGNLGSFTPRNARTVVQSITIEDKKSLQSFCGGTEGSWSNELMVFELSVHHRHGTGLRVVLEPGNSVQLLGF